MWRSALSRGHDFDATKWSPSPIFRMKPRHPSRFQTGNSRQSALPPNWHAPCSIPGMTAPIIGADGMNREADHDDLRRLRFPASRRLGLRRDRPGGAARHDRGGPLIRRRRRALPAPAAAFFRACPKGASDVRLSPRSPQRQMDGGMRRFRRACGARRDAGARGARPPHLLGLVATVAYGLTGWIAAERA